MGLGVKKELVCGEWWGTGRGGLPLILQLSHQLAELLQSLDILFIAFLKTYSSWACVCLHLALCLLHRHLPSPVLASLLTIMAEVALYDVLLIPSTASGTLQVPSEHLWGNQRCVGHRRESLLKLCNPPGGGTYHLLKNRGSEFI